MGIAFTTAGVKVPHSTKKARKYGVCCQKSRYKGVCHEVCRIGVCLHCIYDVPSWGLGQYVSLGNRVHENHRFTFNYLTTSNNNNNNNYYNNYYNNNPKQSV